MRPADFSSTTVYIGEVHHQEHGLIHVLGYQNTAVNLANEPNAMILHIPAAAEIGEDNFIDTKNCPDVLKDMVNALNPPVITRGRMKLGSPVLSAASVRVFEHDIYTVVISKDANQIPEALSRVPEEKRPALNPELFAFYAREFPNWQLAVCCFNNWQAVRGNPLLLWYTPMNDRRLMLPSLDCHTGAVPDVNANVRVDHWVVFGSDEMPPRVGEPVHYRMECSDVRPFLPERVIGRKIQQYMPNGDFVIDIGSVLGGDIASLRRQRAPSATLV